MLSIRANEGLTDSGRRTDDCSLFFFPRFFLNSFCSPPCLGSGLVGIVMLTAILTSSPIDWLEKKDSMPFNDRLDWKREAWKLASNDTIVVLYNALPSAPSFLHGLLQDRSWLIGPQHWNSVYCAISTPACTVLYAYAYTRTLKLAGGKLKTSQWGDSHSSSALLVISNLYFPE